MTTKPPKTKLTVVVVALVLVVAALAAVRVTDICQRFCHPCYPTSDLHEEATITVEPSETGCTVTGPIEQIRTQWQHLVTWTIKGSCDKHTVSVDSFRFVKDGQALDPTEEPKKEVQAKDGEMIKARVKDNKPNGKPAPEGTYTYQVEVRIDGRPAVQDPPAELLICPNWPCE
jgi:hypothetical protein